jgi:hypothetical protein
MVSHAASKVKHVSDNVGSVIRILLRRRQGNINTVHSLMMNNEQREEMKMKLQ